MGGKLRGETQKFGKVSTISIKKVNKLWQKKFILFFDANCVIKTVVPHVRDIRAKDVTYEF